jgi:hypothetical protein
VALVAKTRQENQVHAPTAPSIDFTKLLANGVMNSIIGFEKIKNYVTADDLYRQQLMGNDNLQSRVPHVTRNINRESVI